MSGNAGHDFLPLLACFPFRLGIHPVPGPGSWKLEQLCNALHLPCLASPVYDDLPTYATLTSFCECLSIRMLGTLLVGTQSTARTMTTLDSARTTTLSSQAKGASVHAACREFVIQHSVSAHLAASAPVPPCNLTFFFVGGGGPRVQRAAELRDRQRHLIPSATLNRPP